MHVSPRLLVSLAILVCAALGRAQCTTAMQAGFSPLNGTDQAVLSSTLWDPDGPGPLPESLVIGGLFSFVGHVPANAIAVQDLSSGAWSTLGSGMNNAVLALCAMSNGDLVAAGQFTTADGAPASSIARWNGTTWLPLGSGITGTVLALTKLPNGDLVAGGEFSAAGGTAAANIARWDGTTWSPIGGGTNQPVTTLVTMPNGDLVAGGNFTVAGGIAAKFVARWNGSAWSPFGVGTKGTVNTLAVLSNGNLVAGENYTSFLSTFPYDFYCEEWNGSAWSTRYQASGSTHAIAVMPNGSDFIAGGSFSQVFGGSSLPMVGIAYVSGGPAPMDSLPYDRTGLRGGISSETLPWQLRRMTLTVLPNGEVAAGGWFTRAGDKGATGIAKWTPGPVSPSPGTWNPLFVTFDNPVYAATRLADGRIAVGGSFTSAPGVLGANGMALWDGTSWSALGSGMTSTTGGQDPVTALTSTPNGDIVAGGWFTTAGGVAASRIARWNGTGWVPLGFGVNNAVMALVTLANGDIVAGGFFATAGGSPVNYVARWNGSTWSALDVGMSGPVSCLLALPNGDLLAGGQFLSAGSVVAHKVARWNGTNWSALGTGISTGTIVKCLARAQNGDIVAGGEFTAAGAVSTQNIALWNGTAWSAIGSGLGNSVLAVMTLPNGDLLAGGSFGGLARWNGSTWTTVMALDGNVNRLVADRDGAPFVCGEFRVIAPGIESCFVGRLLSSCPATSSSFGSGCPSSGGNNVLVATTQPWVDSTFVATATGLPTNALVLTVTSPTAIQPGFALNQIFAQSPIGCDLLVAPDIVTGLSTTTGTAQSSTFLPNTPPLVGVTFYQQMIPFDVGGPITATNALLLTAGVL